MFNKSLSGAREIIADTITATNVVSGNVVDEAGVSFASGIKTGNLIDNSKELVSTIKPLGAVGTGTHNTISPHGVGNRANDCVIVFEHNPNAVSNHFISCKLQDNIIKTDKLHADVLGTVADNSATKLLKTNDAYAQFHSNANTTSGKWTFNTNEPVWYDGAAEHKLLHEKSGHHATTNNSSLNPKIGSVGAWSASAGAGVGTIQYFTETDTNGQLKTVKKRQSYDPTNYKPSAYSASDILLIAGNDLHKQSPYKILTTDTNGKLLGHYIWEGIFNSFPMGSSAGGADARPAADQYKQGLVPEGSATHNSQFLRKDGTWQATPSGGSAPTSTITLANIASAEVIDDTDEDNFMTIGRGKLGYDGTNADTFSIAHRDYAGTTSYAIKQNADGDTSVNCKDGEKLTLNVNNNTKIEIDNDSVIFKVPVSLGEIVWNAGIANHVFFDFNRDSIGVIGRSSIGYNGTSDYASFSHRTFATATEYALQQSNFGDTFLNAKLGRGLNLRINNVDVASLTTNDFTCNSNLIINASHSATFEGTSGTQLTSIDNDTVWQLGRVSLGYTGLTDYATFSHRDCANTTDYALQQYSLGDTFLNAKNGRGLHLKVNNVDVASLSTNDFTCNSNLIINNTHSATFQSTSGTMITSNDNDLNWYLGRGFLGYDGTTADEFIMCHRDYIGATEYAVRQRADGETFFNGKTGVAFRIGNADCINLDTTYVRVKKPLNFETFTTDDGVPITDGSAVNDDNSIMMGGIRLGSYHGGGNYGAIYHKTTYTDGGYALLTYPNGTNLGAASSIDIVINNATMCMRFTSSAINHYIAFTNASDIRIKENIADLDVNSNWDAFKTIKLKTYNKLIGGGEKRIGVIADDIEINENEIIKNSFNQETLNEGETPIILNNGNTITDCKSVEYEQLYRMSMGVVQELQKRVEQLELRINNN